MQAGKVGKMSPAGEGEEQNKDLFTTEAKKPTCKMFLVWWKSARSQNVTHHYGQAL